MNPEGEPKASPLGGSVQEIKFRCPTCGAPFYSERTRLCDHCGAAVRPEIILTDKKAEARDEERQWARDLADKFDTTGRKPKSAFPHNRPVAANSTAAELAAKLRRVSCASEFKHRERPTWLCVAGCALSLLMLAIMHWAQGRAFHLSLKPMLTPFLMLGGFISFEWYLRWLHARPICPNCHHNIQACPVEHCQVCGKPLSHKRCADCDVDYSWVGWVRFDRGGVFRWIAFCPGCGVELDTCISRWRARGGSLRFQKDIDLLRHRF